MKYKDYYVHVIIDSVTYFILHFRYHNVIVLFFSVVAYCMKVCRLQSSSKLYKADHCRLPGFSVGLFCFVDQYDISLFDTYLAIVFVILMSILCTKGLWSGCQIFGCNFSQDLIFEKLKNVRT